jgi:hypothetical protein
MILDFPLFFFLNLKQSFALEKHGGKKCYMIGARGLSIIWGDTPNYWTWKPLPDKSRFALSLSLSLSLILPMYLPDDVLHISSLELNEVLRYIDRPVKFMMGKDFLLQ